MCKKNRHAQRQTRHGRVGRTHVTRPAFWWCYFFTSFVVYEGLRKASGDVKQKKDCPKRARAAPKRAPRRAERAPRRPTRRPRRPTRRPRRLQKELDRGIAPHSFQENHCLGSAFANIDVFGLFGYADPLPSPPPPRFGRPWPERRRSPRDSRERVPKCLQTPRGN